jgi:hypothetical protein
MTKFLAVLLIFIGEVIMIYAQIGGARANSVSHPGKAVFIKFFILAGVGIWLTLSGYIFGLPVFKNIWVISVISISSILIVEPIAIYVMTQQLPTRGGLVGFILGALGLLATIVL